MDIVNFWKRQIDLWNDENKCGFCWNFHAPLVNSQINIVNSENCCVSVFLTDLKFREVTQRNEKTGFVSSKKCVWTFSLYALIKSPVGINNYNEIINHPIEESKWENIFKPLINCLGCNNLLSYCDILELQNVLVDMNGDATLVHNYLDENYNGWKVNYTFTQTT